MRLSLSGKKIAFLHNSEERIFLFSVIRSLSSAKSIKVDVNSPFSDKTRTQLSKLHELYENMFDLNSCFAKHLNGDAVRAVSRCQSMTLSELCNGGENNLRNNDFENSSIASEPAYIAVS